MIKETGWTKVQVDEHTLAEIEELLAAWNGPTKPPSAPGRTDGPMRYMTEHEMMVVAAQFNAARSGGQPGR